MPVNPIIIDHSTKSAVRRTRRISGSLASILIGLLVALVTADAMAGPPELPRGKGDSCVAPVDVMRRDHMDFLLHQRDQTVHQGVRTKQHSLTECVSCHVQKNDSGTFIPINAPEQFCAVCHAYASAKIDCFECHATTPDSDESAAVQSHDSQRLTAMSFTKALDMKLVEGQ